MTPAVSPTPARFALTAGWGRHGSGGAVMPGQGRLVERPFTAGERAALVDARSALGETTFDVRLNDRAYWANVPAAVWSYRLGGYQVLKKWLSYRERPVLGRPLHPDEVQHFTDTARRIAAIPRSRGTGVEWIRSCRRLRMPRSEPVGATSRPPARGASGRTARR